MHFQRLRLTGFKSFVEPTDFRIEPGLTGIVGPNGCGKSNLLEALRWVMGANSAKAMRAGGMDDVIFAGSGTRPSRNHAEVMLSIDNTDRRAPPAFNDNTVLEVSRRIDRGAGSTYRINGREVRARDVQLLFADASTGANSPSLVRQGQISELISAKPQNRRLILEEAAGVSGLHGRRHEAELRLRAAEANLTRLDDLIGELEATAARLKREARQAERYKKVSAEIRLLQGAVLYARWADARDVLERVEAEAGEAARAVEDTARAAAAAAAEAARAEAALRPLRDEEMAAAAILHRIAVEKDRLEGEAERLAAERTRLQQTLSRIDLDRAREEQITADAAAALERINRELEGLRAEVAAAPERLPELEAAWRAADVGRAAADAEVERLSREAAAEEARRDALNARLTDAANRVGRTQRALNLAKSDREAVGPIEGPAAAEAKRGFDAALAALAAARSALEAAEAAHAESARREAETRRAAREAEDRLGRLRTEARGLAELTAAPKGAAFAPALDKVSVDKGFEAALAAALGDDLNAALDRQASAHWGGADADPPQWPQGVRPLSDAVRAPPELAARLAFVGVAERSAGERLAACLSPGMRLVSREGDLWRWDGFVARADAPRPAAVRLAQKARLAELEAEIAAVAPEAAKAAAALAEAQRALKAAEDAVRAARKGPPEAERAVGSARAEVERHGREAARRDARAQSLDETVARFMSELAEAEQALSGVQAEAAAAPAAQDLGPELAAAREAAAHTRETAAAARADYEAERRERDTRARRLESLERDAGDWTRRSTHAGERIEGLAKERGQTVVALATADEQPKALQERMLRLLDELASAEARRAAAGDAMGSAEAARAAADRQARQADQATATAREARAALAARLDSARERLAETALAIRESARMEPDVLGATLAEEGAKLAHGAQNIEARLYQLERDREAIGAVNLRAEEEAAEYAERLATMKAEGADLSGAIAKLRQGIDELNLEGRERLLAAFEVINGHFKTLFQALFDGGQAELRLVESDDPLEAGLEVYACPPGKRMATMSLMSGGEQALTATALIFGVFLAQPAPICVLDEVDAPLDDANVDRFCNLLDEMAKRTETRFITITHNPVTMSRMDRLFGVTMHERGVSQLVSVDLRQAEALAAE
ncbi:MAG TPA: chromosome segregation protein SMC [Caulobacteraceae bacterium]